MCTSLVQVLKGYVGDPSDNADWISSALNMVDQKDFDILGKRGSRPLELATLRLQNMRQIVTQWNKLAPPDKELITQQGGTLVFEGRDKIYSYKDKASDLGYEGAGYYIRDTSRFLHLCPQLSH